MIWKPWVGSVLFVVGAVRAQEPVVLDDLHLELTLPPLAEMAQGASEGNTKEWTGTLGDSHVRITFVHYGRAFREPGDVTEMILDNMREHGRALEVEDQEFLSGAYGYAPFASLVTAPIRDGEQTAGKVMLLGGLLEGGAYVVVVEASPVPDEDGEKALRAFVEKGVAYDGPKRDPEWTNEELQERWDSDTPDDLHQDFDRALRRRSTARDVVIRTDNYVVMTNSSGGRKFAQQMEENYREIKKTYPFDDVDGRRLMPVFLFRTAEQYFEFYQRVAKVSADAARRSKGHAWKDYYATWYEAPNDPVHIHESTHQIFANRLRLPGGGSWFQEGVAEYMSTSKNERNEAASAVAHGKHVPLREFFELPSLLYSSQEHRVTGGSEAADNYEQAALLIEFLHDSPFGRKKFDDFLRAVGKTPRNDLERIEAALQDTYGVSIDELDQKFQDYCRRR